MENNEQTVETAEQKPVSGGDLVIDLGRIFRALLHYLWVIIVAVILGAAVMFGYTKLFVTEMYTSSAVVYVSNQNSTTITSSDSNVANAVAVLIKDYDTITLAIEENDLPYTYGQISGSLSTSVGSAGNLTISVTYSDPQAAADIVNAILSVIETRASEIYQGDIYVKAYSEARVPTSKSSPDTTKNVLIGALVGAALSVVVIVLIELLNNKIYDNDYLLTTYNLPVLAEIADFNEVNKNKKYYSKYAQYSKADKS